MNPKLVIASLLPSAPTQERPRLATGSIYLEAYAYALRYKRS